MNLFEFSVHAMLLKDLDVQFGLAKPKPVQYYNINGVRQPFSLVLSYLAYNGTDDYKEAQVAFTKGLEAVKMDVPFVPQTACTLQAFADALRLLDQSSMQVKKTVLSSLMACIAADNVITPKEGELIRAICSILGCPMPLLSA